MALPIVVAVLVGACAAPQGTAPTPTGAAVSVAALPSPSGSVPATTASAPPAFDGPFVQPEVMAENTTPQPIRAISAGWGICAIRADATIGCWNDFERPPDGRFVSIDSNHGSTCAIEEDSTLACWGEIGREVPDGAYRAVSVGQGEACAIRQADDGLTCWAGNSEDSPEPTQPPEGPFTAVSVADESRCAIRSTGRLACWGEASPDLERTDEDRFLAIDGSCAILVDGTIRCAESDSESGSRPPTGGAYTAISAYPFEAHGCAVRTDQTLVCWGDQGYDYQTGLAQEMRTPPGVFTDVTVGETMACATRPDGIAVCWGEDDESARPAPTMWFQSPLFVTDPQIPLEWDALPAFGPITSYDIDLVTRWNDEGDVVAWEPWRDGTPTTSGVFEGTPGKEHCWRARAHDADGRTSTWGGGCTAVPHDESAFEPSGAWATVRDPRYYMGGALRTTERGASLTIDVDAFGLVLFATTCPDCGSIRVIARDGEWVDDVDLASKRRQDRKIVWHWDNGQEGFWAEEGSGHIVIEVTSRGKPVLIDGLLQGPSLDEEGVEP